MTHQLSIIIPVLNEAENLERLLPYILENSSWQHLSDIIVVDGGSTDLSEAIVKKYSQIKFIVSEKGRAKQMNCGARAATGSIFYFLHANSFPPKNFDHYIIEEVKNGHLAGCFRMQFDSRHWWLQLAGWLTQFRWRACRGGDQSQFISQPLFDAIGGYDETYGIYEDNILINALFARNQFVVINKTLKTSARLYHRHGIWKVQFYFWSIYVKKWFGADAETLNRYYKKHLS